jgi:PAT family beta-lactamase induction signal transducer AmpG
MRHEVQCCRDVFMKSVSRFAPVWLMGLANATFGMYAGFVGISLPQLLSKQHLPESQITSITAWVFSPWCWIFLLSPMLDVRFSRRYYATVSAAVAGISLAIGLLNLDRLVILQAALMTGSAAAFLSSSALGGWLSSVLPKEDETRLSSWFNVANISGSGVMVVIAGELFSHLSLRTSAVLLAVIIFLPTCIFLLIPAPGPDRRLARESFVRFSREVFDLLKQRKILVALALFFAPAGSFSLANILSGLGDEYSASAHLVTLVGGLGVILAGVVGSLVFPLLARRVALRPLYLAIGVTGASFTLFTLLLPQNSSAFAMTLIGETVFQALAITGALAIVFETIGQDNPLAATTFCVMISAVNVSLTYMVAVDGMAYGQRGLIGMFLTDAGLGIGACLLLSLLLMVVKQGPTQATEKIPT